MTFIRDLLIAYRAVRDSRRKSGILMLDCSQSNRYAKQAARLSLMTDEELAYWSSQWGGHIAYNEVRRRGLVK